MVTTEHYPTQIEELALCNTKYQTEFLARTLLMGFVSVNKGLRSISLSWPCLDNDTVSLISISLREKLYSLNSSEC